jgi:hypothetical protein
MFKSPCTKLKAPQISGAKHFNRLKSIGSFRLFAEQASAKRSCSMLDTTYAQGNQPLRHPFDGGIMAGSNIEN